jgi:hypothetical protein
LSLAEESYLTQGRVLLQHSPHSKSGCCRAEKAQTPGPNMGSSEGLPQLESSLQGWLGTLFGLNHSFKTS